MPQPSNAQLQQPQNLERCHTHLGGGTVAAGAAAGAGCAAAAGWAAGGVAAGRAEAWLAATGRWYSPRKALL